MGRKLRTRIKKTYIEGLSEVENQLAKMGDAAGEILDRAAFEGAQIVLNAARSKAPVDTGRLRDSLILKKSKAKEPKKRVQYYITKKSDVKHFAPVELGTSKMKAQPFLRPAFDENTSNVAKKVNEEILKALGRVL